MEGVVKEEEGSVADDKRVQIGESKSVCVGTEDDWWFRKGLLKTSSVCPSGAGMMRSCIVAGANRVQTNCTLVSLSPGALACFPSFAARMSPS